MAFSLRNFLEEATAQVNPFDNGKTAATVRAARSKPAPAKVNKPSIVPASDDRARRDQYQRGEITRDQFINNFSERPKMNLFTEVPKQAGKATVDVTKTIPKAFWETGDAVKQLPGAFISKEGGDEFQESLNDSIVGGVGRFGQSIASAALTPYTNRLADQQKEYATRMLTTPTENLYRAYGYDPRIGTADARAQALRSSNLLRTDPLNRSGIGIDDSLGTTTRKVGAQAGEGAFDLLTLGSGGAATKAAFKGASKKATTNLVKSGFEGATGNLLYTAQQDGARGLDYLTAGATGAAIGAALPAVTTKLVSPQTRAKAVEAGKQINESNKALFNVRPSRLTDDEVVDLAEFNRIASTGALMDDATYDKARLAAQKAGIDYRDADQVNEVLDSFRQFYTNKTVAEGGYIAGPGARDFQQAKDQGRVFEGVDGKPRFEVDDSGAKVNIGAVYENGYNADLNQVLDHPTLFKNYPELKNVKVTVDTLNPGTGASYDAKSNTITLNEAQLESMDVASTLLHEAQHTIQEVEGFARGGSPLDGIADMTKRRESLRQQVNKLESAKKEEIRNSLKTNAYESEAHKTNRRKAEQKFDNNPLVKEYQELGQKIDNLKLGGGEKTYRNYAGEAEARAVESRMNMTDGERYKKTQLANEASKYKSSEQFADSIINAEQGNTYEIAKDLSRQIETKKLDKVPLKEGNRIDREGVERWKERIVSGDRPPIIVGARGFGFTEVIDGNHRITAYRELGEKEVPVIFRDDLVKFHKESSKPKSTFYDSLDVPKEDLIVRDTNRLDGKEVASIKRELQEIDRKINAFGDMQTPAKQELIDRKSRLQSQLDNDGVSMSVQPKMKKSRYADRTVPESDNVSPDVQKQVKKNAPEYVPETEAARLAESQRRMSEMGDDFETDVRDRLATKEGDIDSQTVSDTQELAMKLDESGTPANQQKAADLYERLSEHLTAAGQTIQAAAIMARRTPTGLKFYAQKELKKAGVDLKGKPKLQEELNGYIDAVKNAKKGSPEEALARDNVMYFIAKNTPTDKGSKIINFWRAGLLTGPRTSGGALIGNATEAAQRKLWTNPVATLSDAVMGLATGKRTQTLAKSGEFGKGAKAGAKNATSKQYWKSGYDAMGDVGIETKYDRPTSRINYGEGRLGRATGAYVNGVYSLMGALDQPFRYGAQREALSSIAKAEAINKGLKGEAKTKFINDFMENPPKEAMQRSVDEGRYASFQNETTLSKAASGAKQALKRRGSVPGAVGEFFLPFTGVPSSVATRLVTRTPVGTASEMIKQFVKVRKGGEFDQRAMAQAIGEGTAGIPIIAAGFALANAGQLTGAYPSTKKEQEEWRNTGKQPNSVKVGDRWYSLNYIQPFGAVLNIGAGMNKASKEGEDVDAILAAGYGEGVGSVKDQSFLQGISNALDAVSNKYGAGERFLSNTASSVIPNFLRSGVRSADPVQREQDGIAQGLAGALPGGRSTLPERLDVFGRPLPAKDNFANQYLNPLNPSKVRGQNDPVTSEVSRLQAIDEGVFPTEINKGSLGAGTELDEKQIKSLQKNIGQATYNAWNKVVKDPDYTSMSDEDKSTVLKRLKDDINAVEKRKYAAENNIGQFAFDYDGKDKKLTKRQQDIVTGGVDPERYLIEGENTLTKSQKQTYKPQVNQVLSQLGLPELSNVSDEILEDYADLQQKIEAGEITEISADKKYRSFAGKALKSQMTSKQQEFYTLSDNDMRLALQDNKLSKKEMDEVIALDNALTAAGVQSYAQVGKTLRRELGYGVAPSSKTSSSGGRRSGGSKKAKSRKQFANLFSSGAGSVNNQISLSKQLRSLIENAKLS